MPTKPPAPDADEEEDDDPSWGSAWVAAIAAITVSLVPELAVSQPLQRRWGLDLD